MAIGHQRQTGMVQDMEREKLQMQLQQQLQTSEDLVQELKTRLGREEAAVRDLKSENATLSSSATQAKVLHIHVWKHHCRFFGWVLRVCIHNVTGQP